MPAGRLGFQMDAQSLPDFMTLWDMSDPAGTEQKFLEVLPLAESSGDVDYHAQLLTQIGRTYGLRRDFEQAHALFDQADALIQWAEANDADATTARIRSLLERGRTLNWQDQQPRAVELFKQAYDIATSCGNERLAIDAAHMVAIASDLPQQIEWGEHGLKQARKATDSKARNWEGPLLNNLAWSYFYSGQLDEALDTAQQSWEWRRQHGPPFAEYVAKWTVARYLRELGRIDEALTLQHEMLEQNVTNNNSDGYVFEEIGECLQLQGKADEACSHFARAYELLSADPNLNENDAKRLPRMRELGGISD